MLVPLLWKTERKARKGGKNLQDDKILNSTKAPPTEKSRPMLRKVIKKPKNPEAKHVSRDDITGSKRAAPVAAGVLTKIAGNKDVQKAVVEKGIEVAGKMVDKQLKNIEEAQNKASDFLKEEIKLDITPEKGWETKDMFVPPGYHINAEVDKKKKAEESNDPPPFTYPSGMGPVIMNGCWGTGYKPGDPCYNALGKSTQCRNMIDGAAFIGVGFDGRGEYSPKSRKMSIIQRSCAGKSSYDGLQVPDTMNVHGIYDTSAHMTVFTSRSEYQRYLQREAGVSGSFLGFYAGVKNAWGSSESGAKQSNLAIFDIDVDRYEIFQDEVKPRDMSRSFLREFVGLPETYFAPCAPAIFQDFILRWGTHYIKSARFGGQLEIRKTQLASMTASKEEFAQKSEAEFKSLFFSAGARLSTKSGSSSKSQQKYMSTSVVVQGGSQKIAAVISDMYSPTFKTAITEWLQSIPAYPKAFKFLMGSITDLLDFRANDLFPDEKVDWGCEKKNLIQDETIRKGYYMDNGKRVYCEFGSQRKHLDYSLKRKRQSLKRAIEVYMEEGAMSISDFSIPAGKAGCEIQYASKSFKVIFDMLEDLKGVGVDIPKSMSRNVQYRDGKWYTADEEGNFHLYAGFSNSGSGDLGNKKVSIFGLVLTYNQRSLVLRDEDYDESRKYFPGLSEGLKNKQIAVAVWPAEEVFKGGKKDIKPMGNIPCNVHWSNGLGFDQSDRKGKCLHFTASSKGPLYVVFSAVPSNEVTWYYVEISSLGVKIYKANELKVSTVNPNAVALGDKLLYQSYFVCVTESPTSTVIEYGKSQGTTERRNVYLTMIDNKQPIHARFYSFGAGEEPVEIVDSHVISRELTDADCKGDTPIDKEVQNICVQRCHEACDPLAGCRSKSQGTPKASECNECRYAKGKDGVCISKCPTGEVPDENKYCAASYDLKFKNDTKNSIITGFPTSLSQFTLCFWMNFANTSIEEYKHKWFEILKYFNKGKQDPEFGVEVGFTRDRPSTMHIFFILKDSRVPWVAKFDARWHHYCFVVGGYPVSTRYDLEMTVYIDGKLQSKGLLHRRVVAKAGGKMVFGGFGANNFRGLISGLNIWDDYFADRAMIDPSCDGSNPGNVKSWSGIKNELNLKKFTVVSPSTCKKVDDDK